MKIAFIASEATPYAKTGGLADVIGSLPGALMKSGIDVSVFMPRYKNINVTDQVQVIPVNMDTTHEVAVFKENNFFFIDYPPFFDRQGLYGTKTGDFPDNCERFTLFCKAVSYLIEEHGYDLVHCHDWQSGLIPLYLRDRASSTRTVFTIHNLGYQGRFSREKFALLGIDESHYTPEGVEYYGDINFLKAGIVYSDIVTTVSETYAREIQTPEMGAGLDGILRTRKDDLVGIVNGIDYAVWDPSRDKHLVHQYSDRTGKIKNKSHLVHDCALCDGAPLIGMVSRIAGQKGFDILIKGFDEIMTRNVIFVILGLGDRLYHKKLALCERLYPGRVSLNLKFDNRLAHRIYAASDFFLMPSQYEPCGLGQLISLRYGTVPIVRYTGGLADTIQEYDPQTGQGNGFGFDEYSSHKLIAAIHRACTVYQNQRKFEQLSEKCMKMEFSWDESAAKYIQLYEKILSR